MSGPGGGTYAVGMRLYGHGGQLRPSDDDVALLRAALAGVEGVRETQILPDDFDVDVCFALVGSGVWQAFAEISQALAAGLGQAPFLGRVTAFTLRIMEVS